MGRSCRMGTRTLDVTFSRNPFMRKTMKMIDFIKSRGLYQEYLIEKKEAAKKYHANRKEYHKARYKDLCNSKLQKKIMSKRCPGMLISENK